MTVTKVIWKVTHRSDVEVHPVEQIAGMLMDDGIRALE